MRLFHAVTAVAVLFAFTVAIEAADAAKKAQKKGGGVSGTVTDIQRDAGKNTGSFTVKTAAKKKAKAAAPAAGEEKKFVVTDSTKFEKAPAKQKGQKAAKGQPGTPATFADLKQGDAVQVTATGATADKVVISAAKKKAK
jgi:hypothetical protein